MNMLICIILNSKFMLKSIKYESFINSLYKNVLMEHVLHGWTFINPLYHISINHKIKFFKSSLILPFKIIDWIIQKQ